MKGGADATSSGEGVVRANLGRALARLERAGGPLEILGLDPARPPDAAQVRARFLALTKRFHPTRFARHGADVVRLANEVFLRIRAAYAQAGGADARAGRSNETSGTAGAGRPAADSGARRDSLAPASTPRLEVDVALARRRRRARSPRVNDRLGPTSSRDLAERARQRQERRAAHLRAAVDQLEAGQAGPAREALRGLLADDPSDRRVRVYLHYAAGRQLAAAGRTQEARVEYQRALALEPGFAPVETALDQLDGGSGRWSRWFKK